MNSGDSIQAAGGLWNFSDGVATVFDKHIEKSVPGYLDSLNIVNDLADSLLPVGGSLLDIGCSTGTLCNLLLNTYKDRQLTITGIDNEIEMIDFSIKNSTSTASSSELNFVHADVLQFPFSKYNIITSMYTIQFIHPSVRQILINNIYQSLEWGGGFFFFEKVRAPDARFQDIISNAHLRYKLSSFTPEEIIGKSLSLQGVLEPFSSNGNIDLLKRAGFVDFVTVFRNLCFEGVLALK